MNVKGHVNLETQRRALDGLDDELLHDAATCPNPRPSRRLSWLTRRVGDALTGLDNAERAACRVTERVTGAAARAWDTDGRNGVVGTFLDYADGRTAAFEVTRVITNPTALQLDDLLGQDGFEWPLPAAGGGRCGSPEFKSYPD